MSPLRRDGIVPDIIDSIPKDKLTIKYPSGVEVNYGNELTPTQVKDQPQVNWPTESGAYYTLVMTDPDAPSRTDPQYGQVKHWLTINIPGTDISQGHALAEYIGSGPPPESGLHRYIFLVYKQPGVFQTDEKPVTNRSREGRMKWDVREWAKNHNLGEPVACNYYQAQYDDYVLILRKQLENSQ
ncbi:protein D3-like [Oppia nitens]|uniref:protein D3-like n=1 Tax=Oppia nitens TaxID=1686743 RepID=UPI0023DB3114|nr:protein D3-like [Oppia nitens]